MSRVVVTGTGGRLFCELDPSRRVELFVLAGSTRDARLVDHLARPADAEDVRQFLVDHVDGRTPAEVEAAIGVSRQAIHHFRRRARVR